MFDPTNGSNGRCREAVFQNLVKNEVIHIYVASLLFNR